VLEARDLERVVDDHVLTLLRLLARAEVDIEGELLALAGGRRLEEEGVAGVGPGVCGGAAARGDGERGEEEGEGTHGRRDEHGSCRGARET
jgi:hypothetical protein